MNGERLWCLFCIAVLLTTAWLVTAFGLGHKLKNFPGKDLYVNDPVYQTIKYPSGNSPSANLATFVWPSTLIACLVPILYIFKDCSRERLFDQRFYIPWASEIACFGIWTLFYDREVHYMCLIISILAPLLMTLASIAVGQKRKTTAKFWWYDLLLNSVVFRAVWLFSVLSTAVTNFTCFKNSFGLDKAQLIGTWDLETCTTIGYCAPLAVFIVWFAMDFIFYPRELQMVNTVYPFVVFSMFGLFFSNYDPSKELSRNDAIPLTIGILSAVLHFIRNGLKGGVTVEAKKES
ncbi:unnamed protein product [Clavelina lepadiformis]|uniref:Uncharacterized protein n=1 Tax=Clavelina lepadiformis TaxID=159417 RepID=A0ABP0F811_CLALP